MVTPDAPPPPEPQPYPQYVPKRRPGAAILVIGLIIGLVVGGGSVALAWLTDSGPSSRADVAADAAAVCGIIERTPEVPANPEDISLEYMQRWSISEVATSIAKTDPKYQPLADSLNTVLVSIRQLDLKEMRSSIQQARTACDRL